MSGVAKGIKKAVSGVGKVIKKAVKGVAKLGKSIVKGVGKFMGKLGPIGTIAIGVIAPWAVGAMAASGVGWVSALGNGLQAVGSAVSAPFKMAGQALGKGISSLGQATGSKAFMGVTEKVASVLGYKGGSISEGFTNILNGVKGDFNTAFGTSYKDAAGNVLGKPVDLGAVKAGAGSGPMGPEASFDTDTSGINLTGGPDAKTAIPSDAVNFGTEGGPNIFGDMGPKQTFDPTQADPFTTQDQLKGIDVTKATPDAEYTLEKPGDSVVKKLLDSAGSLLGGPQQPPMPMAPVEDSGKFVEGVGAGDGSGARGASAQNIGVDPGIIQGGDYAKMMQSLLARTR